jgi:hypothetical protein
LNRGRENCFGWGILGKGSRDASKQNLAESFTNSRKPVIMMPGKELSLLQNAKFLSSRNYHQFRTFAECPENFMPW